MQFEIERGNKIFFKNSFLVSTSTRHSTLIPKLVNSEISVSIGFEDKNRTVRSIQVSPRSVNT